MSVVRARVSSNGQVSIPAPVRHRWGATEVLVIDKGDRLIVRPVPDDPYAAIAGKYAGPPSERLRAEARDDDAGRESARLDDHRE